MPVPKVITHSGLYYSDPIHGYATGSQPLVVEVIDYSDDGDIVTRDTKTGSIALIPRNNFNLCFVSEADYLAAQALEAKLAEEAEIQRMIDEEESQKIEDNLKTQ